MAWVHFPARAAIALQHELQNWYVFHATFSLLLIDSNYIVVEELKRDFPPTVEV
jgi:hypothetical protein